MYIDEFGKVIRYERKSWGMSKRRLARLSYTDKETIEDIESGLDNNPDFFLMLRICEVLDISVFSLLKDKNKKLFR